MGRFNLKDEADFEKVRNEAETFYNTIGDIYCPYFKHKVAFNTKGLRHLKFKSRKWGRARNDRYARLKLLRHAVEAIRLSHTVQGVWPTRQFEELKTNSRREKILRDVIFYEFTAVLGTVRIRVIVKEVSGGEKHFWSVIPFWRVDKSNSRRILHSGNPADD